MNKIPQVSIGLPIYNGSNYARNAIESILNQTYENFELIISDNCSTDNTEEICRSFAAEDKRVNYIRNEKNLGATLNFNRVFELSKGEYFKWAAHDDILHKDFLLKCVKKLDEDQSIILCHSKVGRINEQGKWERNYDFGLKIDSPFPHIRFHDLIGIRHNCVHVFGVIRAKELKKTPLIRNYVGSDRALLAELGLMSRMYEIPEYLFFRRDHPNTSLRATPNIYEVLSWYDPKKKGAINFPEWRIFLEYLKSALKISLSLKERLLCILQICKQLNPRRKVLIADIILNAQMILTRTGFGNKIACYIKWLLKSMRIDYWKWIGR